MVGGGGLVKGRRGEGEGEELPVVGVDAGGEDEGGHHKRVELSCLREALGGVHAVGRGGLGWNREDQVGEVLVGRLRR